MLENKDDYCTVIDGSLSALMNAWISKDDAERLLTETLEVRKFESRKMPGAAVVKCSKQILWNIPRKILIGVVYKKKAPWQI
jgi:hypothetical protein